MAGTPARRGAPPWLKGLLTDDLGLKVLSLLIAAIVWAWVQGDEVVEARTRAQIHYVWPKGLVAARELPSTLVVTVSGPQGVARSIQRDALSVTVDLSDESAGSTSVDFTELELLGLPSAVSVVQLSPPAIDIELDRAVTRELSVTPTVIGDPAEGWVVARVEVQPSEVEVVGPQGRMRTLAELATDVVEISGSREDRVVEVGLALKQAGVSLAEGAPERVKVRIDVEPVMVERTFEDVPVLVRAAGWKAEPTSIRVTLKGPQESIGSIAAGSVSVLLHPPDDARDGRAELSWKVGETDQVEVRHDGPAEGIEVARLEPRRFKLERGR